MKISKGMIEHGAAALAALAERPGRTFPPNEVIAATVLEAALPEAGAAKEIAGIARQFHNSLLAARPTMPAEEAASFAVRHALALTAALVTSEVEKWAISRAAADGMRSIDQEFGALIASRQRAASFADDAAEGARKAFANDLRHLSDDHLRSEIDEVEDRVNEDTAWLEALVAEREARAKAAAGAQGGAA